jgi:hypothetical protein
VTSGADLILQPLLYQASGFQKELPCKQIITEGRPM